MGRRKASQKKLKKKRPTVATVFKCLFCNHERSVECTLKHKEKIGLLKCRICGEEYQTRIHYLSEPIDVYSEWLDATDEAAEREEQNRSELEVGRHDQYDRYDDDDNDDDDDDDDDELFASTGLHTSGSSSSSSSSATAVPSSSSSLAAAGVTDADLFGESDDEDADDLL